VDNAISVARATHSRKTTSSQEQTWKQRTWEILLSLFNEQKETEMSCKFLFQLVRLTGMVRLTGTTIRRETRRRRMKRRRG
jgi:hypothetical protein